MYYYAILSPLAQCFGKLCVFLCYSTHTGRPKARYEKSKAYCYDKLPFLTYKSRLVSDYGSYFCNAFGDSVEDLLLA